MPFSRVLDWLAPPECAACRVPVLPDRAFCPACAATILRAEAMPEPEVLAPLELQAAFLYGGALAAATIRWKYQAALGVGTALGALFASELTRAMRSRPTVLAPVPLHPRRLAERGFNPAQILGKHLGQSLGVRVVPWLLRRVRDTPKQSRLGFESRQKNVAGAFTTDAPLAAGMRVLLVDDVCTTGATLLACRTTLLRAGAEEVHAAVLARTP